MSYVIVYWLAVALLIGLWRGIRHEESFLRDFSHGFRCVLALPVLFIGCVLYFLARLVYAAYDFFLAIAELIAGEQL